LAGLAAQELLKSKGRPELSKALGQRALFRPAASGDGTTWRNPNKIFKHHRKHQQTNDANK
jgi:hypothetical protein